PVFFELAKGADEHDEYALPNMARSFGFGNLTGIKGLEEAAGIVPDPKWKQDNIGEPWYRGDAVNMGIGQGFVTATPLQIANAFFVAYANRSEPSILALAALETGESGSREAAPMIRNILEAYLGGALVNQP